jgi:exodeoxyribonuclease V beta subunit
MLVEQTLTANIEVGGKRIPLNAISRAKRVNELEFNFPVNNEIDFSALAHFFGDDSARDLHVTGGNVMGMMTGFIDLLFEHEGKYYILDWKSNFLGDQLHHYDQSAVMNAMNENNYHLQYLIYALAVEKFLKSKLPNFDFEKQFGGVIYLFLRGTRSNENSGVFVQGVTVEEVGRLGAVLGGN